MRQMSFQTTFSGFSWTSIVVQDTVGLYRDGVWVEDDLGGRRDIRAIPFAMRPEELEIYSDGLASAGGITLTTADRLWWSDINAEGQERKQSYVYYQNYRWRVMGENLMLGNVAKLTIYSAVRFIQ